MARMTLDDLRTLLIACAGADEGSDLSGDILDTPFEDLGYDSLALMETAARIERDYGVTLSDEQVTDGLTPRILLALVNEALAVG
ncbi:acyl carrier protein [Streptomyces thermoviolaceus]|jgi:act minimal PKS acyl carrier protein|uniref:Acyl carrier protein n=1 Tax=Streptomyces thermoviolaceus subsp. thermoviolaceus TaxID=66860 RepID=A0ABX0YUR9_STRTL|nr:acyl carrier protein [Streptomyces thermoviolaceus]MCM3264787.1 acyl carrier protein [Streptomyces thermoviolaceus]NJP16377.1 acyl carrier protein [Streptomyces thermoviolaceus subsp. thermoviolaceus]WTD48899.1 acyl carrier protein [Streptomyces thermoviolaceus]GHB08720.1 actinorhodin polyketide synthase acyl carrier protein [Streptomyces thermoviolaceus subsp. thermoviolaceus]